MKKIYSLFAIVVLGLMSCSKENTTQETSTITDNSKVITTPTQVILKISSRKQNFDFSTAKVWVTTQSVIQNNEPVFPTNVLEKVSISSEGIMMLDTEKYIGKTLYFNVFTEASGKISLIPYTITDKNNKVTFKDALTTIPQKGTKVESLITIN